MPRGFKGLEKWGPLILQLVLGFIFCMHEAQKLFGPSFYGVPWDTYLAFFTSSA